MLKVIAHIVQKIIDKFLINLPQDQNIAIPHSLTVEAYREWLALFVLRRLQKIIPSFRWQEVQSFADIKRILDEYNISWLSILEQERYKLHKYFARVFYDSTVATKHLSKVLEESIE